MLVERLAFHFKTRNICDAQYREAQYIEVCLCLVGRVKANQSQMQVYRVKAEGIHSQFNVFRRVLFGT